MLSIVSCHGVGGVRSAVWSKSCLNLCRRRNLLQWRLLEYRVALEDLEDLGELEPFHLLHRLTFSERRSCPLAAPCCCWPACPPCQGAPPWSGRQNRTRAAATDDVAVLSRVVIFMLCYVSVSILCVNFVKSLT